MKPEIKTKWVEALRSGEYSQGQNYLHTGRDEFCCLGVLCDLANREGVVERAFDPDVDENGGVWVYRDADQQFPPSDALLPTPVQRWAGIDSLNPDLPITGDNLAALNDSGKSFGHIAQLIEEEM